MAISAAWKEGRGALGLRLRLPTPAGRAGGSYLLNVAPEAADADEGEVVLRQLIVAQRRGHVGLALQVLGPPPPQGPRRSPSAPRGACAPCKGAPGPQRHPRHAFTRPAARRERASWVTRPGVGSRGLEERPRPGRLGPASREGSVPHTLPREAKEGGPQAPQQTHGPPTGHLTSSGDTHLSFILLT